MKLRKLRMSDAPYMFEWMQDPEVVGNLSASFLEKKIMDSEGFINESLAVSENLHLAIADNEDLYMGTVSLKNIDRKHSDAEFGIVVRKCAMGKGYSSYAMKQIMNIGFQMFNLKMIYWCVSQNNERAKKFYDKMGYEQLKEPSVWIRRNYTDRQDLLWYSTENPANFII